MQRVAGRDLGGGEGACGELDDGMSAEAPRDAPGRHAASYLSDDVPAVEEDEIDREAHSHGVHGFAGHDPETFAGSEGLSAEQAATAGSAAIRDFHARGHDALRAEIADLTQRAPLRAASKAKTPEPERKSHDEAAVLFAKMSR